KNLGISMGKNSSIFHRLPNDTWGLLKWYPNVKMPKKAAKQNGTETVAPETVETDETPAAKTKTASE
ncbi:MAG TPA: hypothetical protein VGJ69_09540, partial [Pyrinomonadaceae bacterium]